MVNIVLSIFHVNIFVSFAILKIRSHVEEEGREQRGPRVTPATDQQREAET